MLSVIDVQFAHDINFYMCDRYKVTQRLRMHVMLRRALAALSMTFLCAKLIVTCGSLYV